MSAEEDRKRKRYNERKRKRYAEDPEYRKSQSESHRRSYETHRAEINERKRLRWAADPEYRARGLADRTRYRLAKRLKTYGISVEDYERMLALQNGACAICKKKPKRRLLCLDHCHRTGKLRGLLCGKCNSGLGFYDDDPIRTQAAADYLKAAYARLMGWQSFEPTGDDMIPTGEQPETGKAGRLMRSAILLELRCPPRKAEDGATDMLRLIARKLVAKAAEGDIQAIKEVLDRIDGKTVPGPDDAERGPRQVSIRWKDAPSPP